MKKVALGCSFLMLFASAAVAQTSTFEDDFEGGLLASDMPPGVWSLRTDAEPLNFFGTSTAAAKVGAKGLRNLDTTSGSTSVSPNRLVYTAPDAGTADQYTRVWFRGSNHNLIGSAKVISIDLAPLYLPAAELYYSSRTLRLRYFNRRGTGVDVFVEPLQTDGQWVLLELYVTKPGTAQGTVALSLDGQLKYELTGIDWSGQRIGGVQLGNLYSVGDFQATLDFDDLQAGPVPRAAVLAITGPAEIDSEACVPYVLTVRNSFDGGTAPLPYDLAVTLAADAGGGVTFSPSATCTPTMTSVTIDAGVVSIDFFVRGTTAELTTLLAHNDHFPDGTLAVFVDGGLASGAVDAGEPPVEQGPAKWSVGCGCQSGADLALLSLLALVARRAR